MCYVAELCLLDENFLLSKRELLVLKQSPLLWIK